MITRRLICLAAITLSLFAVRHAAAQTVADIAARGVCSTAGVEGLSSQLAESQVCAHPGSFVEFAPYPNITLTSSRVYPFVQASARDAIRAVADITPLSINSAFRTVADQYVLYNSGGCGLAARPGSSNHQSGRAIDVGNHSAARATLEAHGCAWLGSSDPVHFDCPGMDLRADAITAFQHLWNVNHPEDPIAEDGAYGPQTDSRLARSPAAGFADSGCGCMPGCDGDSVIMADCSRVACGAGDACRAAACVFDGCADGSPNVCVDADTFGTCVLGDLGMTTTCANGCVDDASGAHCAAAPGVDGGTLDGGTLDGGTLDGGTLDSGAWDDASDDAGGDGGRRIGGDVSGGCGCRVGRGEGQGARGLAVLALLGLVLLRRTRG